MAEMLVALLVLAVVVLPLAAILVAIGASQRCSAMERQLIALRQTLKQMQDEAAWRRQAEQAEPQQSSTNTSIAESESFTSADGAVPISDVTEKILPASPTPPTPPAPPETTTASLLEHQRRKAERLAQWAAHRRDETPAPLDLSADTGDAPRVPLRDSLTDSLLAGASPAEVPLSAEPPPRAEADATDAADSSAPADAARVSWEERLGARAPVWIGAVALALAGVFLVRYIAQQGLLGPAVRVAMAGGFGLLLMALGEWLRAGRARIAQGLTAAGVAVLYASVLSAVNLHSLIPAAAGVVLMIAITAAAVLQSLRHGPFVALLGLLGGFIMPGLLGLHGESTVQLFGYLLLLQGGLVSLSRARAWWPLMLLTLVGGYAWVVLWIVFFFNPLDAHWVGLFLLGSIAAFVIATINAAESGAMASPPGPTRSASAAPQHSWPRLVTWLAVAVGLVLSLWLTEATRFATMEWVFLGVLGAGTMVLGRLRSRYLAMAALVAGMSLALLAAWGWALLPAEASRFAGILLGVGCLYAGGAFACLWGSPQAAHWSLLSAASGAVALVIGYQNVDAAVAPLPWWAIQLIVAAMYLAAAAAVLRRRDRFSDGDGNGNGGGDGVLAPPVFAAVALVTWSMHEFVTGHDVGRQWIAVAWALQLPLLAFLTARLRLPPLRTAIAVVAGLVCWRLLATPFELAVANTLGSHVLFNWLLYGYGLPVACLALSAWQRRRAGDAALPAPLLAAAIAGAFIMITLLIRHGFHREALLSEVLSPQLAEFATYGCAWMAMGLALLLLSGWRPNPVVRAAANLAAVAGIVMTLMASLLIASPLWSRQEVGDVVIFNLLLYALGLPALLMGGIAWVLHQQSRPAEDSSAAGGQGPSGDATLQKDSNVAISATLVLLLLLITFQVRHGFHAPDLRLTGVTLFEWATYAVAWSTAAIALLWISLPGGLAQQWQLSNLSSAAVGVTLLALFALAGVLLFQNPLWHHHDVGDWPILNGLLYLYGLPAGLLLAVTLLLRRVGHHELANVVSICVLILLFTLVTFEVRQAFVGPFLDGGEPSNAEWYAYSAAWILFAAALLALGVRFNRHVLRFASLAVMLVAVAKVFLFDTRHLEQLWRVLSFLGLGVSLMVIAWVYQRFVFGKAARSQSSAS